VTGLPFLSFTAFVAACHQRSEDLRSQPISTGFLAHASSPPLRVLRAECDHVVSGEFEARARNAEISPWIDDHEVAEIIE
jgi:hypothetical protein